MTDNQTPYASTVRTCIETLMEQGAIHAPKPPKGGTTCAILARYVVP